MLKKYCTILGIMMGINSMAQESLKYEGTQNQSMSKYQRIGHIEEYLKTVSGSIAQIRSEIDSKMKTGDKNILSKMESLEKKMEYLSIEVDGLKKSIGKGSLETSKASRPLNNSEKDKFLDLIEENAAKINVLQSSFRGLENTMKSLQEGLIQSKEE
jgi:regulator of replication initiation timing